MGENVRIRELREQAGLTQGQIAEHMGVDQAAVHRWEIGKAMPRAAKLPELAALLHCTIDELYSRVSPRRRADGQNHAEGGIQT